MSRCQMCCADVFSLVSLTFQIVRTIWQMTSHTLLRGISHRLVSISVSKFSSHLKDGLTRVALPCIIGSLNLLIAFQSEGYHMPFAFI